MSVMRGAMEFERSEQSIVSSSLKSKKCLRETLKI